MMIGGGIEREVETTGQQKRESDRPFEGKRGEDGWMDG